MAYYKQILLILVRHIVVLMMWSVETDDRIGSDQIRTDSLGDSSARKRTSWSWRTTVDRYD